MLRYHFPVRPTEILIRVCASILHARHSQHHQILMRSNKVNNKHFGNPLLYYHWPCHALNSCDTSATGIGISPAAGGAALAFVACALEHTCRDSPKFCRLPVHNHPIAGDMSIYAPVTNQHSASAFPSITQISGKGKHYVSNTARRHRCSCYSSHVCHIDGSCETLRSTCQKGRDQKRRLDNNAGISMYSNWSRIVP